MKRIVVDEKALRKMMIDQGIKTISDLSSRAGVSKPTIYEYLSGKSPLSSAFTKLCDCLEVSPSELLTEIEETEVQETDV